MTVTTDEIRDNLQKKVYEANLPYNDGTTPEEKKACRDAYHNAQGRGVAKFRDDLENCFNTASWPSADKMWWQAWEDGHSYGLHEVFSHYMDLVDVVQPTIGRLKDVAAAAHDYLKGFVLKGKLEQVLEGLV